MTAAGQPPAAVEQQRNRGQNGQSRGRCRRRHQYPPDGAGQAKIVLHGQNGHAAQSGQSGGGRGQQHRRVREPDRDQAPLGGQGQTPGDQSHHPQPDGQLQPPAPPHQQRDRGRHGQQAQSQARLVRADREPQQIREGKVPGRAGAAVGGHPGQGGPARPGLHQIEDHRRGHQRGHRQGQHQRHRVADRARGPAGHQAARHQAGGHRRGQPRADRQEQGGEAHHRPHRRPRPAQVGQRPARGPEGGGGPGPQQRPQHPRRRRAGHQAGHRASRHRLHGQGDHRVGPQRADLGPPGAGLGQKPVGPDRSDQHGPQHPDGAGQPGASPQHPSQGAQIGQAPQVGRGGAGAPLAPSPPPSPDEVPGRSREGGEVAHRRDASADERARAVDEIGQHQPPDDPGRPGRAGPEGVE